MESCFMRTMPYSSEKKTRILSLDVIKITITKGVIVKLTVQGSSLHWVDTKCKPANDAPRWIEESHASGPKYMVIVLRLGNDFKLAGRKQIWLYIIIGIKQRLIIVLASQPAFGRNTECKNGMFELSTKAVVTTVQTMSCILKWSSSARKELWALIYGHLFLNEANTKWNFHLFVAVRCSLHGMAWHYI